MKNLLTAMKDTHTVMEIDGKIVVVVNAPEKPYVCPCHECRLDYIKRLNNCTKYPTLEQDAEYWKERIGQRVEVEIKGGEVGDGGYALPTYAIPPQQKQGDLWDEAEIKLTGKYPLKDTGFVMDVINYLKQHYTLKRK